MTQQYKREPELKFYKPLKKDDSGAALQFKYSHSHRAVFLEAARQKGPKLEIGHKDQFDWENKIIFKMGDVDMARILLTAGRGVKTELLHSTERDGIKRTTVMHIIKQTGDYDNYQLKISTKENDVLKSVVMYLDHHEMLLLARFLGASLDKSWGF